MTTLFFHFGLRLLATYVNITVAIEESSIQKPMKTDQKREQLNGRLDSQIVRGVRLVAAANRDKRWTQDMIIEAALRAMLGCNAKKTQELCKAIQRSAKELSLSFNNPESQPTGFAV